MALGFFSKNMLMSTVHGIFHLMYQFYDIWKNAAFKISHCYDHAVLF